MMRSVRKPDRPADTMTRMSDHDPALHYFAYGSNMHPEWLRRRVPSAVALGRAVLAGFALRLHKRGADGSGKCNALHTGRAEDRVHGVVYRIAAAEKACLDRFEEGYRSAAVQADVEGVSRDAWTYLALADAIDDTLVPFDWYRDLLVAGARAHRLPGAYIARLAALGVVADPDRERARQCREIAGAR
jgi:gamma-glutamylcyclotransferase (GGCT)/AIG2-like uncharacterized protein YtfP